MYFIIYADGEMDEIKGDSIYVNEEVCYIENTSGRMMGIFPLGSLLGVIHASALTDDVVEAMEHPDEDEDEA